MDHHTARALLKWQIELGATEAIGDVPIDRYALPQRATPPASKDRTPVGETEAISVAFPVSEDRDPVLVAREAAQSAQDLQALKDTMARYGLCDLRKGARNLVFADGVPRSRLMIIGEAPGRDEDREGRPFVGRAGRLLDRMLAAIGHS